MKIVILSGSPRMKGNVRTAMRTIERGVNENLPDAQVEFFDVTKLRIGGCINCDRCLSNGGSCIQKDGFAPLIQKIVEADVLLLGTPVYWWGVSSQLKAVIDRFYCQGGADNYAPMRNKKLGLVAIGEDALDSAQYRLIREQFECISKYLDWEFVFYKTIRAHAAGELAAMPEKLAELEGLWSTL